MTMPNPSDKLSEGEGVARDARTPGPWKTGESAEGIGVYGCGFRVARMTGGELRRDQANARLIAAAPELAAAATDALAGWRYIRTVHGDLSGVGWDRVEQALSAALSRLTPSKE